MKKLLLLLLIIPLVFSCNSKKEKKISKKTEFKNGRWISTTDSTEGIEIKNGKWIWFNKKGETESIVSIYDFKILRGLKLNSGKILKNSEYLAIITDRSDTLKYAILEYSNELLSLSYIGRGNTLNYIPEKEKEEEKEATEKDFQKEQESFLEKYNNTIWTDGISTIRFRKLSSIKYTELTKQIKGYVFDGFLKKNSDNIKLYIDQGYFIIKDNIETIKNIYDINTVNGLGLREYPSMVGKIVDTLDYGISVKILNKTGEFFEIDGKKGQWAEIETYNPYGHRQHLFPDNDGRTVFVNEVSELDTYLECHMCGYKKITQNIGDILSVIDNVRNDFGDIESSKNSFLINNNELIHTLEQENPAGKVSVESRFVPLSSDSIYIEEVKKENKIKYKLFNDEWQRIRNEYELMLDDY